MPLLLHCHRRRQARLCCLTGNPLKQVANRRLGRSPPSFGSTKALTRLRTRIGKQLA